MGRLLVIVLLIAALLLVAPFPPPVTSSSISLSIDRTGATNVSAAMQAFIDSRPDGSVIEFDPGTIYRLDTGILLRGRSNLIFEGNGATLRVGSGDGKANAQSLFYLGGLPVLASTDIVIRDFVLEGNSPTPGTYIVGSEAAAGITVHGGARVEIANVTVRKVYGDGLTINAGAANVWMHDSTVESAGRNGVSVIVGSDTLIERSAFPKVGYSTFDIEPWTAGSAARRTTIRDTTAGTRSNTWLSANGNAGTTIDGVTFTGNRTTGTFGITINQATTRRQNVVITDNIADTPYTYKWQPLYQLARIDGLTFLRNAAPLNGGAAGTIIDCTSVVKDVP